MKFGFVGPFLCLPQRGRGTAERWMRRASFRWASGVISLGLSKVFAYTRMKTKPALLIHHLRWSPFPAGEGSRETYR